VCVCVCVCVCVNYDIDIISLKPNNTINSSLVFDSISFECIY